MKLPINSKAKRLPYGMADFVSIRRENFYYVDKTKYIPLLEKAGKYIFLIRPRRFGKSLWLTTLACYYDIFLEDKYETVFKDTYIYDNPTEEKSSYLLLNFNFSVVNPALLKVERSFEEHCENVFFMFKEKYRKILGDSFYREIEKRSTSYSKLDFIFKYTGLEGLKVLVEIDEYDNFANTILTTEGQERYRAFTHGEGFFRHFFNVLKGGASDSSSGLARLYITGVSPVTMDDVTSGFNIGKNITLSPEFNEMIGFSMEEVLEMLEYYKEVHVIEEEIEYHYDIMSKWYDNYRFSRKAKNQVFNSDMVLYYIDSFILSGCMPDNLIDQNVKTDYSKLRHLIMLDRELNGNFGKLKEIIEDNEISSTINISFPVEEILYPENFISLLYFLGLLTIDDEREESVLLKIPNETIKRLFYGYLRRGYEDTGKFRIDVYEFNKLMRKMAMEGEWEEVFEFLAKEIKIQTGIRDYLSGEKVIVGFLLAYLNITGYYLIQSEVESNKGYADLILEPFRARYGGIGYGYLIEVKYINRGEYSEEKKKEKEVEARKQLDMYGKDPRIERISENHKLRRLILVFSGWELVYMEEV